MNFETWEPVYEQILASFGYSRNADERARDLLGSMLSDSVVFDHESLDFTGDTVAIAGGAQSLSSDLALVAAADVVIATADAAVALRERGYPLDCVVSDLDGSLSIVRDSTAEEIPVVIHAHGDNRSALDSVVPTVSHSSVIPTTQAEPTDVVRNFGGFTDGDRAAFLADYAGARKISFPGWDFDDSSVSPEKRAKLRWAERLLFWLERRRNDRFDVLDGRRDGIETDSFPVE